VVKAEKLVKIEHIVARKEEILDALFERTYASLSPCAKQVFLTLCNWRSTIPQLAVEAVMLRQSSDHMDVDQAVEELRRCSFIEVATSKEDSQSFLTVPLVASVFGRKKLIVSPMKVAIEANTELLLYFGAGQKSDIRHGISGRVKRFFAKVAEKVSSDPSELTGYVPMLEFIAQRHPEAWLLLARLYQESAVTDHLEKSKEALRRYLETCAGTEASRESWEAMVRLCRWTQDGIGEVTALVEMCSLVDTPLTTISNAINRWNLLFKQQHISIPGEERDLLGRKLLELFDRRAEDASATDLSRAGWLAVALNQDDRATAYVAKGLQLSPDNEYCVNLAGRLTFKGHKNNHANGWQAFS
jgi:hypothetical protein